MGDGFFSVMVGVKDYIINSILSSSPSLFLAEVSDSALESVCVPGSFGGSTDRFW